MKPELINYLKIAYPVVATVVVGAMVVSLSCIATARAAENASVCDRKCLEKFVGDYVAAMVKHDPAGLRVTPDIKVSENSQTVALGAGDSWKAISSVLSQPQFVADIPAQEVGYVGVVQDGDRQAFLGLRLKIKNNAISEAESILTHDGEGGPAFEPQGFIYREAPYIRDVPLKVRSSRDGLVKAANTYWDVSTGSHDGSKIPYTTDCWHFENGMNTNWERYFSNDEGDKLQRPEYQPQAFDGRIWVCAREAYLSTINWTQARDRHYVLDEERGLAFNIIYVDVKGRSVLAGPNGNAAPNLPPPGAAGPPAGAPPAGGPPGGAGAQRDPIEGPGGFPLGMSMAGMRASMAGLPHTMVHFEVMRIVGGKIAREQDVMRLLPEATKRTF